MLQQVQKNKLFQGSVPGAITLYVSNQVCLSALCDCFNWGVLGIASRKVQFNIQQREIFSLQLNHCQFMQQYLVCLLSYMLKFKSRRCIVKVSLTTQVRQIHEIASVNNPGKYPPTYPWQSCCQETDSVLLSL